MADMKKFNVKYWEGLFAETQMLYGNILKK